VGTAEAELCARIQDTIDDHLATHEGGGFVTGWYFVAEYIDTEGDEAWLYATAAEQRAIVTMGLLKWAKGVADFEQHRYLNTIADE
jgi:hypothetical protein